MRRRVETIRRSPSRTSYAACRVAGSLRRKPPRATRRSTSRRGERRTERNTPAILAHSDEETTSVAGRATPDKPPRADAPPRAAVGLGEWRAIRRRSPLQIYLRPAGGAAAPVGWRSIPPAVASRQWSLLSRGRLLHSHWALFEILQQDFVARFQGRVPRHRAAERSVLRPQRQRSRNRLPLWIVWFIENILSGVLRVRSNASPKTRMRCVWIHADIDTGRPARSHGPFQGRAKLARFGDPLRVATEHLHDALVTQCWKEFGEFLGIARREEILLSQRSGVAVVVGDHNDDWNAMPHGCLEVQCADAETSVATERHHQSLGRGELGPDGKRDAAANAAVPAGIQ